MQVICLEEVAFYELVGQVVARLKVINNDKKDKWISDAEAMELLNIKSKTTLQKLRDEGKIRFSQPQKKIILHHHESSRSTVHADRSKQNIILHRLPRRSLFFCPVLL